MLLELVALLPRAGTPGTDEDVEVEEEQEEEEDKDDEEEEEKATRVTFDCELLVDVDET